MIVDKKIKDSNSNFIKGQEIIESDIKFQNKLFNEMRRRRKLRSNSNISRQMPKTNTILEQITNLEDRRRSSSNQNKSYEVLKRNEIILKCPESKNTRSISEIFEEYFKKFHFIYFQTFCETLCSDVIKHIGEFHKNKLNVYFSFEDQIKELELLTTGDTGNI